MRSVSLRDSSLSQPSFQPLFSGPGKNNLVLFGSSDREWGQGALVQGRKVPGPLGSGTPLPPAHRLSVLPAKEGCSLTRQGPPDLCCIPPFLHPPSTAVSSIPISFQGNWGY